MGLKGFIVNILKCIRRNFCIFFFKIAAMYEGGPKSNGNWAAARRESGETHCSTRCLLGRRLLSYCAKFCRCEYIGSSV